MLILRESKNDNIYGISKKNLHSKFNITRNKSTEAILRLTINATKYKNKTVEIQNIEYRI